MKEYLPSDTCKRKLISEKIPGQHKAYLHLCKYCSTYLSDFHCDPKCSSRHLKLSKMPIRELIQAKAMDVSEQQENELQAKLAELMTNIWLSIATKRSFYFPNFHLS